MEQLIASIINCPSDQVIQGIPAIKLQQGVADRIDILYLLRQTMIVAHNLVAMNAGRQFNTVTNRKQKIAEKLSSGYRIGRAADDAAGLSISEKMRKQIRGLSQGTQNAQDGVSLLQVADGALAEVHDMLHRITELSVQAANGTNSDTERDAIQQEISEIVCEINRISDTTKFNERALFQGAEGTTIVPAVYDPTTVSGFTVNGTPTSNVATDYRIRATDGGFSINGTQYSWSSFQDGVHTLADASIEAGTYTFSYEGLDLSVTVQAGAKLSDAVGLLNGASFSTKVTHTTTRNLADLAVADFTSAGGSGDCEGVSGRWRPYVEATKDGLVLHTEVFRKNGQEVTFTAAYDTVSVYSGRVGSIQWGGSAASSTVTPGIYALDFVDQNGNQALEFTFEAKEDQTLDTMLKTLTTGELQYYRVKTDRDERLISSISDELFIPVSRMELLGYYDSPGVNDLSFRWDYVSEDPFNAGANYDNGDGSTAQNSGKYKALVSSDGALTLYPKKVDSFIPYYVFKSEDGVISLYPRSDIHSLDGDIATFGEYVFSTQDAQRPDTVEQRITGIKPSNVTVETNPVLGLKDYRDSGYKGAVITPEQRLHSEENLSLWIQSGAERGDGLNIEIGMMDADILGLSDIDVTSQSGANAALDVLNEALSNLSANRSRIGAQQNRLEHTIRNNDNVVENTQAAESQIRDADMAKEMMQYSLTDILSQAGISVMTQANQSNQGVLSLLQ